MFTPIGSHVNENEKKIIKISIFKNPKRSFVWTIGKKIQKSWKLVGVKCMFHTCSRNFSPFWFNLCVSEVFFYMHFACTCTPPPRPIFLSSLLWWVFFELLPKFWEILHQMTQKWPWLVQGQNVKKMWKYMHLSCFENQPVTQQPLGCVLIDRWKQVLNWSNTIPNKDTEYSPFHAENCFYFPILDHY